MSIPPSPTSPSAHRNSTSSLTSPGGRRVSADRTPSPTHNLRAASSMPGSGNAMASSGFGAPPDRRLSGGGGGGGVDAAQTNRKVMELQSMFPNIETSVIQIVLEGSDGSSDRAIEQLLLMADPDYKPETNSTATRTEAESQTDLDAQLARSLQLQDQEEDRRFREMQVQRRKGAAGGLSGEGKLYHGLGHTRKHSAGGGEIDTGEIEMIPYQPRVRRARPAAGAPGGAAQQGAAGAGGGIGGTARSSSSFDHARYSQDGQNQGDNPAGMLAVEDKLNQFAEVGKQTFNSLLTRAKAKYGEYQAAQAASDPNRPKDASNLWGLAPGPSAGSGAAASSAAYGSPPGGGRGGVQNYGGQGHGQQHSMWDDGRSDGRSFSSRSESFSSASEYDPAPPSQAQPVLRQSGNRWQPTDAFDDNDPWAPKAATTFGAQAPAGSGAGIAAAGGRKSPAVGSPDKALTGKIDPAKLGILPKKKVDLLSSSPGNSTGIGEARRGSNEPLTPTPPPAKPAPAELVSKLPPTPPAESPYKLQDSDDELEYTRNPFDEK